MTETKQNVNSCQDTSLGDHGVLEGDRISGLKSHGPASVTRYYYKAATDDRVDEDGLRASAASAAGFSDNARRAPVKGCQRVSVCRV